MRRIGFGVLLVTLAVGCQPRPAAEVGARTGDLPATRPATAPSVVEFFSAEHEVRLTYPARWTARPGDALVLVIVPPGGSESGPPASSISLDVPKLPPHPPGMIPINLVVNGYVKDLRKQHPELKLDGKPTTTKLAGAVARRVRATWEDETREAMVEESVLAVHDDRVYIFRANYPAAEPSGVLETFNVVLESVKWD